MADTDLEDDDLLDEDEDRQDEGSQGQGSAPSYAPRPQAIPTSRPAPAPAPAAAPAAAPAPAPTDVSADVGGKGAADTGTAASAPAPQGAIPKVSGPPNFAPRGKSTRFDPSTAQPDPTGGGIDLGDAPAKPKDDEKISWSDYGKSAWTGVLGMGEDLLNAGRFAAEKIGASPETLAYIDRQRQAIAGTTEDWVNSMSPRAQEAMHASLAGYLPGRFGLDAQGNKIPTPGEAGWGAWLGMSVAQLVPQVVAAVVPGTIAGKAVVGVLSKAGVATKAIEAGVETATTAAKVAGTGAEMATTGSLFGAQNAGAVYGEIVKQIGAASDKDLMADPTYAADRARGLSVDDAKKGMIDRSGNAVGMAAAVGAVAGAGTGGLLTRGALGAGERGLATRAGVGAAEGGLAMGGQGAANEALTEQATGKPVDSNAILAAGVASGLPGAVMGAGGGMFHGREAPAAKPRPSTEADVRPNESQGTAGDPTVAAGLGEALNPTDTKPPPGEPPTTVAHQPQPTPPEAMPSLTPDGPTRTAETGAPASEPPPESAPLPPEQAPAGGAAPVAPGEAPPAPQTSLPAAPEAAESAAPESRPGTQPEQAQPAAPSTTGLTEGFGQMGQAIGDNLRDMLWSKHEAGDATEAGAPSNLLRAAQFLKQQGAITDRASFDRFVDDYGKAQPKSQADLNQFLDDWGKKNTAESKAGPDITPLPEGGKPETPARAPTPASAPDFSGQPSVPMSARDFTEATHAQKGILSAVIGPDGRLTHISGGAEEDGPHGLFFKNNPDAAKDHVQITAFPGSLGVASEAPLTPQQQRVVNELQNRFKREGASPDNIRVSAKGEAATPTEKAVAASKAKEESAPAPPAAEKAKAASKAKSKRAAQKAAMEKPTGERMKGEGAVAETAPVTAEEARAPGREADIEEARADAVQNLRDALGRTIEVKKGVDPRPLVNRMLRDLSERMGHTDGSNDAVAEMLHLWRNGPEGEFPGLAIARKALGGKLMREVTGHDPERIEVARARAEEEGRRGVEAKRAPSSEAIEETAQAAPETAEGEREGAEGPTEKPRPKTTDAAKIGNDLLDRVLSGEISPEQAHAEYGKRRKEGHETFADFVKTRIAHAEDTTNERQILDAMGALEQDKKLSPNARRNKLEALKAQLARTGPEHANELRERVLSHLEDPVGQAVDAAEIARQAKLAKRAELAKGMKARIAERGATTTDRQERAPVQGIPDQASRFIRAANSPQVMTPVLHFWANKLRSGQRMTTRDLVRFLQSVPGFRENFRPYHQLLNVIAKWLPDREIITPEEAHARGLMDDETLASYQRGENVGQFTTYEDPRYAKHDFMVLSTERPSMETFVHEAMHSITTRYINHLLRTDPNGREMQALRAIGLELRQALFEDQATGYFHPEFDRDRLHNLQYALKNERELHTHLMTSPDLWAYANEKMASPELRAKMTELGYPPSVAKTSIWSQFRTWIRTGLGFDAPKSASELTMLDHFLGPAQRMTENAAHYNAKYLPRDPLLNSMGKPAMDVSSRVLSPRAGRMVDDALDRVRPDTGRWGDRVRRFLLPGATSDAIVDRYHDILPSLGAWRTAGELIDAKGKKFADTFSDRVKDITNRWNKLDDPNKLGQLQVDATIARAHLGDDVAKDANDHLTTQAQKNALADVQRRYANLSPAEKSLYKDMRDIHREMYQHVRDAQLTGLVRGIIPDASDGLVGRFRDAAKSQDGLNKFIDESSLVPAEARKLLKGVSDVYSQGYLKGDYFPLRRYGDYVVRVGSRDDPENYSVEMFDSHAKAAARRAELVSQGVESVHQVARKSTSPIHDLAPSHPAVDELYNTMSRSGAKNAEAVRDMLKGILLEHATHSEAARTRMRRRGVKGADVNQARILNDEFLNNSMRTGYAEHGLERTRALSDMENEVDQHELPGATPGNAIKARAVYDEMQKRSTSIDPDNPVQSLLSKANRFSFAHALMSPSHMLTSSMEAHTNSLALLGARHGIRAGFALTRALAEASPIMRAGVMNTLNAVRGELEANDWNLLHVMRDRAIKKNPGGAAGLRKLYKEMETSGAVDHTQLQDIRQSANPTGAARTLAGKAWNRFYDFNAASAHAVDVMNKTAIASAAYHLEMRRTGGDVDASVKYAMDTMRKAMPNYSRVNAPRIATARGILGPLGAPLLQFKRYGLHMYSVLANLARDSMHGENKYESAKAFAGILATHAMMAGTLTWIADPLRYIGGAYDLITGKRPHDYQNDVRAWMNDTFGKEAGEAIARGLPHLAGFDVHNRVGLANLLEIPGMKTFDKQGIAEMLFGAATGAPGEAATDAADGAIKLMHGDIGGFMTGLIPRPMRDLWKAGNLATSGVPSQAGTPGLPAAKLSTRDIIYQGLGFQPSDVTEFREGRNATLEAREEAASARNDLTHRWLQADPSDRADIMAEIRQYNADPQHTKITVSQLIKDAHAQKKQAAAPFGLRLPKRTSGALAGAGSFANVPQ